MLETVQLSSDGLILHWQDEYQSFFHYIWLRDNCRCETCGEPSTGRRQLRLSTLDLDVKATNASVAGEGVLHVNWNDGHASTFNGRWLRQHAYDETSRCNRVFKPLLWTDDFRAKPPAFQFSDVNKVDNHFLSLLHTVRDHGLGFIHGTPTEEGTLEPFAEKIGFVQENNFGRVQNLVVNHTRQSVANRTVALKPHNDEPYRASPPGILLFHCVETDVTGAGSSIFLDGFEIAEILRQEDPEGFYALTKYPQAFRRHFADDVDLIAEFPVISVDGFDNVTGVRINDRVAAPLSMPSESLPVYYRGMKRLLKLAEDETRFIHLTLQPGDIVIFDNHRVLHGRTGLTINGRRWLQWLQVERGDFHSTMRIVADRLGIQRTIDPLLRGAYS